MIIQVCKIITEIGSVDNSWGLWNKAAEVMTIYSKGGQRYAKDDKGSWGNVWMAPSEGDSESFLSEIPNMHRT